MKKVLMFLSRGFEDLEAVTIIDVLGWTHVREHLTPISLTTCGFHDQVTGKFGTCITPDHNIKTKNIDYGTYDAFALPGGFHDNVDRLKAEGARYTEKSIEEDDNIISCAGPASALVVARLTGKENANAVKKLMIHNRK